MPMMPAPLMLPSLWTPSLPLRRPSRSASSVALCSSLICQAWTWPVRYCAAGSRTGWVAYGHAWQVDLFPSQHCADSASTTIMRAGLLILEMDMLCTAGHGSHAAPQAHNWQEAAAAGASGQQQALFCSGRIFDNPGLLYMLDSV